MYADTEFADEQYTFTPQDTFYIVLDLTNIGPGEHVITTHWLDPWGRLERQNVYRFTLENLQDTYRVYSWLQLWKKGLVTRTFIGRDYDDKFYGIWNVQVYLDGLPIAKKEFKVV